MLMMSGQFSKDFSSGRVKIKNGLNTETSQKLDGQEDLKSRNLLAGGENSVKDGDISRPGGAEGVEMVVCGLTK